MERIHFFSNARDVSLSSGCGGASVVNPGLGLVRDSTSLLAFVSTNPGIMTESLGVPRGEDLFHPRQTLVTACWKD
jgi:hypothetical protein